MAGRTRKPVAEPSAFWDSSALVPLCVRERGTPQAISLYRRAAAVVWWAAPVEIASALARLLRTNQLTPQDWTKAHKLAAALADTWSVIHPTDGVRSKAVQVVERYDLRAGDALQLAAALEWCEDSPQGMVLLTADERLLHAALLAGFDARRVL